MKIVEKKIYIVESFCVLKQLRDNIKNLLIFSDSDSDCMNSYYRLIKQFLATIKRKNYCPIKDLSKSIFNFNTFEEVCNSLRETSLEEPEKYISSLKLYFNMSILEFQAYLNIKDDFDASDKINKNLEDCLIEIDKKNKPEKYKQIESVINETHSNINQYEKVLPAKKQISDEIKKTEDIHVESDTLAHEDKSEPSSINMVSESKLLDLLPNDVRNDFLRICNYTISVDKNHQEEMHLLLEKYNEFLGAFLTNQESFCYYLQNKLAVDISEKSKNEIYDELKNKWNKINSITSFTKNRICWISKTDLSSKKEIECEYKYFTESKKNYKDFSPYFIKSSPFTYKDQNYGKYRIIHYSNKETIQKYLPSEDTYFNEIEYLLNDEHDKEENKDTFEQLIKDNNVMSNFTKCYDAMKYNENVREFVLNILFKSRGYDLIFPDDNASKCEVKYITTSDESLDGKTKENIYGLKKATTILINAQSLIYRYDSTYFLKVFISDIKALKSYSAISDKIGIIEPIINNLIKNIDLINQNDIVSMDGKQKKSWILGNGTMSIFFEIDPEKYMNELKKCITNDTNLYKQISIHTEKFINEWNKYLKILNSYGIKRIEPTINKTKVTVEELKKGWEVSNPEIIYTNNKDEDMQVREIIQYGIEVDDIIIRAPKVKTYIYKNES